MSDIATRYMKLVEKRPELAVGGLSFVDHRAMGWCRDGGVIGTDVAHALIFAKLVEALPKDHGAWPLTLEAVLAWHEVQA